ncbi:acetate--CoA ligase family protein [Saccharopolyspora sp. 6V]|uniref:acetate--CoA ligase family protein n=1 Tax=Saccharopolyspora sp. 6V TaxID=2877239 RepID=UPI001CD7098A|nr:acetate--CoA ligase family protein [Saccharopolyspora sp. 6V]MCA1190723.1 acetate--CoA ligase family protein [Saccharopolyspora sp. 6V]
MTTESTSDTTGRGLHRLLAPRHVAVYGGAAAAAAIRQSRKIGFAGRITPVHPRRAEIDGIPCVRSTAELPEAPDAAFLAVPPAATVTTVRELAARGAGGVVCHASGFAEHDAAGAALQRSLVAAAGGMPLIGPNCLGVLNYLDGAALWPEEHGGHRVDRGVAVIAQSGTVGQNLTMQRRSLPLAQLVALGNGAVTAVAELIDAALDDPRITAIGLHLEGVDDVAGLSRAGLRALRRGVPIVVLKTGSSAAGARTTLSHTSSLAGSDELCDALFRRVGMARVRHVSTFVEALKFLHANGPLPGRRITSASASGGEAALLADLAERAGLELPEFPAAVQRRMRTLLGERVSVANPLDYHTYIWGDRDAQTACFTELFRAGVDCHLLLADFPRGDRCEEATWDIAVEAFGAAHATDPGPACVVSSLPEGLPEPVRDRLLATGIAPMQGTADCAAALAAAADIGAAQRNPDPPAPLEPVPQLGGRDRLLDEPTGKRVLAARGVTVPDGRVVSEPEAPAAAAELGFPVVVKAVSADLAHKSDAGGVRLGLTDREQVRAAVAAMSGLADRFLVERMVGGAVAELIVGVRRDPRFGPALTVGAGGVLVELVRDAVTLLLPVTRAEIRTALAELRIWPLLTGFRGPAADVDAVVDAVAAIAEHARADPRLLELDVNPLLALPHGAVAVDVLVREARSSDD